MATLLDHELQLSEEEQRELWREWEERGPQGPIEDDCGAIAEAPAPAPKAHGIKAPGETRGHGGSLPHHHLPTTKSRRDVGRTESMTKSRSKTAESPSELIDARIEDLGDWRGEMLARLRTLIHEADPTVVEEWKWRVPVWSHNGILCTGETYKSKVKSTFAKGASLEDPSGLFNSSLEGNTRRAIDFHEGDAVDEKAFQELIRAAVALNESLAQS